MSKTNIGLAQHCEKALKEAWYYLWGAYAQISTQVVIDDNIKQYPDNQKWRNYAEKSIGKTRVCDCYGLVKSYLWWDTDKTNPKYNSSHDTNTAGAYSRAKEKGTLSTLPEIVGTILYMSGHVGVYMGNGRFIECMGGGVGMFEGNIENNKIVKGSKFTNWFKDMNISYAESIKEEEEKKYMITKTDLEIDGILYNVNRILQDDKNYIELREFEKLGFDISYDTVKKIPVLRTK